MSDLIEREDAIKLFLERKNELAGIKGDLGGAMSGAAKLIESLPSAEPEAKPPKLVAEDRYIKNHFKVFPHCPQCNVEVKTGQCYCMICGQHIDWSEERGDGMSDFAKDTNVPTNDCISRQAALDAVNDCGICIQKILDLPSAEPKWILVSEQLPMKTDEYLVCYNNGDVSTDWYGFTDYGLIAGFDEDIIAWMPLPKPYSMEMDK